MSNERPKKTNYDPETERQFNAIADTFVEGFIAKMYSDGIVKGVSVEQLYEYLANPDNYIIELENIAMFNYITTGEVFQLFDLAKVLPTLNYKIEVTDKGKNYEKNMALCNKILNKVKHRLLTRDIISQEISSGTLVGIWLGDKKNPYFYIFDNLKMIYPSHRINGDWQVVLDLSEFSSSPEDDKEMLYDNLNPYFTKNDYDNYKSGKINKNFKLPQERTVCLRTHTLKRNQRYGINWSTNGLLDIGHKKKLKDLEKAVANKLINSIAVLTIGSKDNELHGNLKLNPSLKKKVYAGVRTALEKNNSQGVTVIGIPEYTDLKFPDMKSDALDDKKFNSINNDITSSFGTSPALLNGTGGNFASAKINLDILYKKIAVLLEEIETEVYGKLLKIILPQSVADNYQLVYDKSTPLTTKEKLDYLFKLHSEGYAIKPIIDSLDGVNFTEYIEQSLYEIEKLKLREKIIPPLTSYTITDETGKPVDDNSDNQNTIVSKENDGNNTPSE